MFHRSTRSASQSVKGSTARVTNGRLEIQFRRQGSRGRPGWSVRLRLLALDMPKPPAEDLFVLPDEYPPGPRSKRAVPTSRRNEELNVETLVVVDTQMLLKHGRDNVTTYVLTILNMVRGATRRGRARRHARRASRSSLYCGFTSPT